MFRGVNVDQDPDDNRLAEPYTKRMADETTKEMHRTVPAVLSCDEWPAARYELPIRL
jgi:hypothetical protein